MAKELENIKLLNNKLAILIRIRGVVRISCWPSKPMTRVQIPAGPYRTNLADSEPLFLNTIFSPHLLPHAGTGAGRFLLNLNSPA